MELLIYTEDKIDPADRSKDVYLPKAGHVIDVRHDGWPWSDAERAAPFMVIKCALTAEECVALQMPHKSGEFRQYKLELSAVSVVSRGGDGTLDRDTLMTAATMVSDTVVSDTVVSDTVLSA